ncbi:amino acid adenylation domain-containing protein, partial [Fibrella sp. WM1]|uniref:non-ribosomal peptide synthetase n=1 Tax=Fibrella musci TaxID=3242485 RepID=UPI003521B37D
MFNKQNIQDIYKLSPIQAGIYFHWLSERETAVYIGQSSYRFHGDLRLDLVQQALNTIFERHAILRTIYTHKKTDDILQIVLKKRSVDVAQQDLRHLPADERDRYIDSYLVSDRHRPFDLNRDAPMRLAVLQSDERVYDLVWTNHHIAVDGWCLGILISEFFACYNALVAQKPHELAPAGQYGQFVQWLNEQPQATAASYWTTYLTEVDKPTGLPLHTTTPTSDYVPDEQVLTLTEADTTRLHTLAEQNRLTVSCLLQASWSLLLARYNDTDRVVFGLVSSVRPPVIAGVDRMVGPLINTLPIAPIVDQTASLLTLAAYLQTQRVEGDQYSYMPLSSIQAAHPLGNQLLDHVFVFENFPVSQLLGQRDLVAGIDQIEARSSFAQTNYNLNLIVLPERQLSVLVNYNQAAYSPAFISQVVADFQAIIAQLLAAPDAALRTIQFPSTQPAPVIESEEADCAVGLSLPTLFRQTASRRGNHLALVDQNQSITYADLSARVDRLASWMRQEGVQSGDVVGVCLDRSADWVLAVLAIWQAGGVYLPLLPTLPLERQRHMLSDSRCRFGIGDSPAFGASITVLSMAEGQTDVGPIVPTDVPATQTAYIIYTSGTSGLPKGVPIRHESLVCRALDHGNWLYLTDADVVLQSASISFDASLIEVTMTLLAGAKLAIAKEAVKTNTDFLTDWLDQQGVTTAIFSPAYLRLLNRHPLPTVRNIITTGEAASLPDVLHYAASKAVFNGYGPTETCVGATYHRVDANQADRYAQEGGIPIGKPFAHTAIYLLNQAGEPVPTGCVGELCVTGIGLANGYLNDDVRTAEKFIANPYARQASEDRLYRTGDLGYVSSTGDLQYVGRADDQIQLHGVRVEPKEIEAVFRTHDAITEAVVLFDRKTTQLRIALQSDTLISYTDELRTWASTCLPAHMIPSEGIVLASFPLTASGKIDRHQLMNATPEVTDDEVVAERILLPEPTQQLMAVFADLLGKANVKPTDHFFRLGGDSIKAIQIVSRMHRLGYKLDVQTIFKHPIIDDLANQLSRVGALIEQTPAQGSFPLTPILASFANQPRHNPNHFNQAL